MRSETRVWRRSWVCLMGLVMAVPWAVQAQPATTETDAGAPAVVADPTAVLKVIPAEATAFMVIRHPAELNKNVVEIARALGLPLGNTPESMFPAPLDWLKESFGLGEGLDENGSFAVVMPDCRDAESFQAATDRIVLLLPARRPEALINSLNPTREGDVVTVSLAGEPFVAAARGDHVLLARSPEASRAFLKAGGDGIITRMSPDRVKAFASSDLFMWMAPRGLSPAIREEFSQALTGMMAMAGTGNPGMAEEVEQSVKEMNRFMDDTEELTASVNIDARGVGIGGYFRVRPESELGRRMAATRAPGGSLLTGLPNEPTVFAGGIVTAAGRTEAAMREAVDRFMGSEVPEGVTPDQVARLKEAMVKVWSGTERVGLSLSSLAGEGGQSSICLTVVAEVKDSARWVEASRETFEQARSVMVAAARGQGGDQQQVQAVADTVQWKKAAEKAGELPVDLVTLDLSALPQMTPEDADAIRGLLGADGFVLRVVAVDPRHVLLTVGGNAERTARLVELVRRNEAPLGATDSIKKVAGRLPDGPRLMEGYLNLDQFLVMIANVMMRAGQPVMIPFQLRGAAPLGFAVTRVDNEAQEMHAVVPTELLVSIKESVGPLLQMMMSGGFGGQEGMDMNMDMEEPLPDETEPESELK